MSPEDAVDALSPEGRTTPPVVPGISITVPPVTAPADTSRRGGGSISPQQRISSMRLLRSRSRRAIRLPGLFWRIIEKNLKGIGP